MMEKTVRSFTSIKNNFWLLLACGLIAFNLWHNSIRGVWTGSVRNSLTVGPLSISLAQSVDPLIHEYKPYDGQFYYAMTFDPLLITKNFVQFIDAPAYRYKRFLLPLLAFIVSLGHPSFFPYSLLMINIFAWVLAGYGTWKLAGLFKIPNWLATFGIMTLTGLTFATFRTLSEPLAFALVLWGLYFWLSEKSLWSLFFSH